MKKKLQDLQKFNVICPLYNIGWLGMTKLTRAICPVYEIQTELYDIAH